MTESSGLTVVIDLLIDISSHLEVTEDGMEVLKVDRPSTVSRQSQSPSTSWPAAECDHSAWYRATPTLTDLSEE